MWEWSLMRTVICGPREECRSTWIWGKNASVSCSKVQIHSVVYHVALYRTYMQLLFFFFFSGWCCHGVTTQVFYSENIRYKYHMQSWIWIWYALITSCSDYHTDVVWNPPLLRAVIGLPKCSSSLGPAKIWQEEREAKGE